MELKRRPFQGVLNILSFNRHFYVWGLLVLAVILASRLFIDWPGWLFVLAIAAFAYGLFMPLIVSAYVYDFSGFYRFDWLRKMQLEDSEQLLHLNINAGFDETSFILKEVFPQSQLQVFDFYNAAQHTEAAIIRARKASLIYPNTRQISTQVIPLPDNSVDKIFLLSAVHEIRKADEKAVFLKECRRVCKSGGQVIMVEHLRDFPNFVAFTIGFTHFFSKAHWQRAFTAAGFQGIAEQKFTPFMSVFKAQK